jgi:hypothetical protein
MILNGLAVSVKIFDRSVAHYYRICAMVESMQYWNAILIFLSKSIRFDKLACSGALNADQAKRRAVGGQAS